VLLAPRTSALVVLWLTATAHAGDRMEPDDLPPPRPEIAHDAVRAAPPAVPSFELPALEPGMHGPRELRAQGTRWLGAEIQVVGYVTAFFKCTVSLAATRPPPRDGPSPDLRQTDQHRIEDATNDRNRDTVWAKRAAEAEREAEERRIAKERDQCSRPRFHIGDTRGASLAMTISVVDAPKGTELAVGERVVVTGTWTTRTAGGEHNTAGMLVYKAVRLVGPPAGRAPVPAATSSAASDSDSDVTVVTRAPMHKAVANPVFNESVDHFNACNRRIAAAQYDEGLVACEAAVRAWDGNHLAWYTIASAHVARGAWTEARAAAERAVAARPDRAMYQLYYGMALYEIERQRAVEPSELHLAPARAALVRAVRLEPGLWRAHYYLGRVYRDLDDPRRAAEAFTRAIAAHPVHAPSYVALSELYRRWDQLDEALAVAMLGASHVAPAERWQLWYEAGMALDVARANDRAIDAFSRAIADGRGAALARFQRAQVYLRKGDLARARRDLADVVASTDPDVAAVLPIAQQLLGEMSR
jgi:predicted Zn-dependent protease